MQLHLHEIAVDKEIWTRPEWATFDLMCHSLLAGGLIPGWVHGESGHPASVQGLALGFDHRNLDYVEGNVCKESTWFTPEMVKLAEIVGQGLQSIGTQASDLGAGKDKPAPFANGMWGWHVAKKWTSYIAKKIIVFGPMAAWQNLDGWYWARTTNGSVRPKKVQGPG